MLFSTIRGFGAGDIIRCSNREIAASVGLATSAQEAILRLSRLYHHLEGLL